MDDWFDLVDVESGEIHMTLTYKRSRVRVDGNHRSYSQVWGCRCLNRLERGGEGWGGGCCRMPHCFVER